MGLGSIRRPWGNHQAPCYPFNPLRRRFCSAVFGQISAHSSQLPGAWLLNGDSWVKWSGGHPRPYRLSITTRIWSFQSSHTLQEQQGVGLMADVIYLSPCVISHFLFWFSHSGEQPSSCVGASLMTWVSPMRSAKASANPAATALQTGSVLHFLISLFINSWSKAKPAHFKLAPLSPPPALFM